MSRDTLILARCAPEDAAAIVEELQAVIESLPLVSVGDVTLTSVRKPSDRRLAFATGTPQGQIEAVDIVVAFSVNIAATVTVDVAKALWANLMEQRGRRRIEVSDAATSHVVRNDNPDE